MILLGSLFGGIHLAAWDAHFPSREEQVLWRIASWVVIGAESGAWLSLYLMSQNELIYGWTGDLLALLFVILSIAFIFGRGVLFVEAFSSVRSFPVGAYITSDWVNFLPHVG